MFNKLFKRVEVKFLFELLRPYLGVLVSILFFNILLSAITLFLPYLVKLQTDQLQQANTSFLGIISGSPFFIFIFILGIVLFSNALKQFVNFFYRLLTEKIRKKLTFQAETKFFEKLSNLDSGFLSNPRNRRITNNIFNVSYIFERALMFLPRNFRSLLGFLGVIPLIVFVDYRIGIFTFVMSLVDYLFYKERIKQENQMTIANDTFQQKIYDLRNILFYNFQKILLIDQGNKVLKTYQEKEEGAHALHLVKFKHGEKWSFLFWILENLTILTITLVFGYQVLQGDFTLGDFTMITMYALQLKDGFASLLSSANELRSLELDFLKLGFFLNLKPKFKLAEALFSGPLKGDIEFKNVSFRYPSLDEDERNYMNFLIQRQKINKDKLKLYYYDKSEYEEWEKFLEENSKPTSLVLKNLDFTMKQGQITALIGRNGSGKTTMTNLLLRAYDAELGDINVGGVSLSNITPAILRKNISILTQEVFLVNSFSVRDNLLLGVEKPVSDEEIWTLLERFFLLEKINQLPKKLDAILGDEVEFSGGQKQLISIIRTYLQARPVVVFDEGTNQLDAEHEGRVMDFLQELKARSTILIITHKLTSARKADKIYVLDDGKIIEEGAHAHLLEKNGFYSRFWNLQVVD